MTIGFNIGDLCNRQGCQGRIINQQASMGERCGCGNPGARPPCSYCTDSIYCCSYCSWTSLSDYVNRIEVNKVQCLKCHSIVSANTVYIYGNQTCCCGHVTVVPSRSAKLRLFSGPSEQWLEVLDLAGTLTYPVKGYSRDLGYYYDIAASKILRTDSQQRI